MKPLAYRLRPKKLADFVGQDKLVSKDAPLRTLITSGNLPSMIFWGPPGTGKTTLAEIIANEVEGSFERLSAVTDGKAALKAVIASAKEMPDVNTILFIDEIHRWNKAQQDALLPYVESGIITLIGATTENPSFSIISPLLSRAKVFIFGTHLEDDVNKILERGISELSVEINDEAKALITQLSNGDLRFTLNSLELAANISKNKEITKKTIEMAMQRVLVYDKKGDMHFNIISAIHKSLRSSNASAAIYWITRMLKAGEDPLYVARRLVRFSSEDIGNAQPNALLLANVVYDTCKKIGMPECGVVLIQLAEYLAKAPKNNSAYIAYTQAEQDVNRFGNLPVPLHLRNAPTKFMKELDYGKGYEYDHDLKDKKSDQECFPDKLKNRNYFTKKS